LIQGIGYPNQFIGRGSTLESRDSILPLQDLILPSEADLFIREDENIMVTIEEDKAEAEDATTT